jgi:hypothetical protein
MERLFFLGLLALAFNLPFKPIIKHVGKNPNDHQIYTPATNQVNPGTDNEKVKIRKEWVSSAQDS